MNSCSSICWNFAAANVTAMSIKNMEGTTQVTAHDPLLVRWAMIRSSAMIM